MYKLTVASSLSFLLCSSLFAQEPSAHAKEFVEVTMELRRVGVPSGSWGRPAQPPFQVPPLLRRLNSSLRGLLIELLARPQKEVRIPDLWTEVTASLERAGWEEVPRHKWAAYGELDFVDSEWFPAPGKNVLVVTTTLWVPCGADDPDATVYVFEEKANRWRLVLQTEANYEPRFGEDDTQNFQIQLSPFENDGSWFLAVATVPPTCDQRPLAVNYRILKPGNTPEKPFEVLRGRESLFPNAQPAYEMRTETDWFSITRPVIRRLDGEPGVFVSRWRIGQVAQRAFPLAYDPEDFLDHWVQLPWSEAASWAATPTLKSLREWHSKLNRLLPGSIEITFVQPCKTEGWKEQWHIGLHFDFRGQEIMGSVKLFAVVVKEKGVFRLDSFYRERPSGCPGKASPKEKLLILR